MKKTNSSDLITKEYINERFENFTKAFRNEMRFTLNTIIEEFRAQFSAFSNRMYSLVDPVVKEIEEKRQEKEIGANQIYQIRSRLKIHEKRIAKLEQVQKAV